MVRTYVRARVLPKSFIQHSKKPLKSQLCHGRHIATRCVAGVVIFIDTEEACG